MVRTSNAGRRPSFAAVGLGALAAALTSGAFSGAVAQTAAPAAGPSATGAPGPGAPPANAVTEVVVTAERRTENLQRVPISATVLNGSELRQRGVFNIQDLQQQTPGLSIQPAVTSETFINIRGVGIQQTGPTSSNGVAFYVDGIYIPSLIDTVDGFYDLQNVEVLRGPQGTLVGSNSTGGAIFVNSAKPVIGKFSGYVIQSFGDYSNFRTEAAINLPVTDTLALRIAGVRQTRDSFTTNVGSTATGAPGAKPDNQPGNVDYEALRAQLLWKPNSSLDVDLRVEPYKSRTDGFAQKPFETSISPTNPSYDPYAAAIQGKPFLINYSQPQYFDITGGRYSGTGALHLGFGADLKSATSFQQGNEDDLMSQTGSSAPSGIALKREDDIRTFTQEVDLISTLHSNFQWVVGGYFLHSQEFIHVTEINNPTNVAAKADHTTEAVFGSLTYTFPHDVALTVGGRYSHDLLPYHELMFPALGSFSTKDSKPTGTAKLTWQVTPKTLVYGSISSGYKAGGINLQIPAFGFTPPPFQPETNVVGEVGVKTTLLDNHLRINADAYDSKYKHYQLEEFNNTGFPLTQSPGDADIYGAELESQAVFGRAQANLGVAYNHGDVSRAFLYTSPTGTLITIASGTRIPYAPEWTVTAGLQYTFDLLRGELIPRIQYQYQSEQFALITHDILQIDGDETLPSHGTADIRLTYNSPQNWSLEGYVTNFADSHYIAAIQAPLTGLAPEAAYGAPREYGVRVTARF